METNYIDEIFEKITFLQSEKENVENTVKQIIKDKSYSLRIRWNLFTAFCELFKYGHSIYYLHIKNMAVHNFFDGGFERYETIYIQNMLDSMKGNSSITEKDTNEFKEQCMEEFVFSFTYDW